VATGRGDAQAWVSPLGGAVSGWVEAVLSLRSEVEEGKASEMPAPAQQSQPWLSVWSPARRTPRCVGSRPGGWGGELARQLRCAGAGALLLDQEG
jgi:hypothetical protein